MKTKRKTSIFWTVDINELKKVLDNSNSLSEVLRYFGKNSYGGNYKTLVQRILHENLDLNHYKNKWKQAQIQALKNNTIKTLIPLEKILTENSTYNRNRLRHRLLNENILKNECSVCGLPPEWNGKPLSLQLDHINGVPDDNRIENLRIICPNCHTQTETFAGRKTKTKKLTKNETKGIKKYAQPSRRKTQRPETKEELQLLITKHGYVGTGKLFGVSDNAVRKWLKYY